MPQDWYVSNGSSKRVGGGLPYTDGPRLLRFTNSVRAFEYGLLVQNITTKEKAAWAKFGDKSGRSQLTMHPGRYILRYKLCNWNNPEFAPVTIAIEDSNGQEVASVTYTPNVNIGGKTTERLTGVGQQTFEFDIPEKGDYVIVFYADAARNADFVLGQASILAKEYGTTDINLLTPDTPSSTRHLSDQTIYDLQGRKVQEFKGSKAKGVYIQGGKKYVVK